MLSKISSEEVIKGFVCDYSKIKDAFKEVLRSEGFIWWKAWERHHFEGREGVWFNPVSHLSIRIRWGIINPSAIIYIEKEFIEKIEKFLDWHIVSEGIDFPNQDYGLLNKGEFLKQILKEKNAALGIIEGNLAYLEKEKNNDTVKIVLIGGTTKRVKLNKLDDFVKRSGLTKEIKTELKILIAEANTKWLPVSSFI